MAAELEYVNGTANIFYSGLGGTPWHKEGVPLSPDQHFDFDGVMERHFQYPLEKLPYFLPTDPSAADDQKVYVEGTGAFYVWRPDTKKVLEPVGSAYEIVTNAEAFEVLKPLVDERVAALETGGVLRDGADAWLLVRWNLERFGSDARAVFEKEGVLPYATVMANHSGRRGIMLGHTAIRIVCRNTLGAAENEAAGSGSGRWMTITHKGDAKSKLVEAAQSLFGGVVERFEAIAKAYRVLMNTRLTDEAFSRLVLDVVAPDPRKDPKFNPEAKLAAVVVERADKKRAAVRNLWFAGKGHSGEPTAWFAYNGAVEALDFNRELWPTRSGSWRTASLLDGELGRMKNRVLDYLVEYATETAV